MRDTTLIWTPDAGKKFPAAGRQGFAALSRHSADCRKRITDFDQLSVVDQCRAEAASLNRCKLVLKCRISQFRFERIGAENEHWLLNLVVWLGVAAGAYCGSGPPLLQAFG